MSSLAGWQGSLPDPESALQRMAEAMSGPWPVHERHADGEFAVVTVQPAVGESIARIASSEDGQVTAAFAGYLFTEDAGTRRGPAQHCLQLYLSEGLGFPERLNGSFALVIRDRERSELHLVTDRLMTRALYYCTAPVFLFGTEVKPILEAPGVSRQVNANRLLEFLLRGQLFGPATYYDHIRRAPEASVTTWDGSRLRSTRYWKAPFDAEKCRDIKESATRLHRVLTNATRRACAGAERPGMLLSGGLDSRCIATAAAGPLHCITMHQHAAREVRTARRVAEVLGYQHQFVRLPASFPLEVVSEGARIADGMDAFLNAQPLYLADPLRETGVQTLMHGRHLEVFFSETELARREWRLLGLRGKWPMLVPADRVDVPERVWRDRLTRNWRALRLMVADPSRLPAVIAEAKERITAFVGALCDSPADPHALTTFALTCHSAAKRAHLNAATVDRLVPGRLIACDTEVIDLLFTVLPEHRLFHRLYARLLTQVDPRLRWVRYSNTGVPVSNCLLAEYLAAGLYSTASRVLDAALNRTGDWYRERFTRSAWPRVDRAMRACPAWHRYLRERLASSRLVDMGLFAPDGLREVVEDQIAGRRNAWVLVAAWITLEEWLSCYG